MLALPFANADENIHAHAPCNRVVVELESQNLLGATMLRLVCISHLFCVDACGGCDDGRTSLILGSRCQLKQQQECYAVNAPSLEAGAD